MSGVDGAASIQACAMRVSRLSSDGTTPAGSSNAVITNQLIKAEFKVVNEAGDEFTSKNGCGSIALTYKGQDKLKRLDLTLTVMNPDPELAELTTAGSLITSGGQTIGYSAPAVGAADAAGVCVELWSKAWIGGGAPAPLSFTDGVTTSSSTTLTSASAAFTSADVGRTITGTGIPALATIASVTNSTTIVLSAAATASATVTITLGRPGPYWRWVFPKFVGALGDFSLENAPREVSYVGPVYENSGVGNGPNNDFPSTMSSQRVFSYFRDTALPTTTLGGYGTTPAQV